MEGFFSRGSKLIQRRLWRLNLHFENSTNVLAPVVYWSVFPPLPIVQINYRINSLKNERIMVFFFLWENHIAVPQPNLYLLAKPPTRPFKDFPHFYSPPHLQPNRIRIAAKWVFQKCNRLASFYVVNLPKNVCLIGFKCFRAFSFPLEEIITYVSESYLTFVNFGTPPHCSGL